MATARPAVAIARLIDQDYEVSGTTKLLTLGFAGVLAMGVALLWFTRDTAATPTVALPVKQPVAERAPAGQPAPSSPSPDGTVEIPKPADGVRPVVAAAPTLVTPTRTAPDEPMVGSNGRLIGVVSRSILQESLVPTHDLVIECIRKSGLKPTGEAIMTFTVAKNRDKGGERIEVETTGVEEEGTTITNPELIECLHKTALAMKFPPNPSSTAVWAKRKIVLENGVLNANYVFEHGYIR